MISPYLEYPQLLDTLLYLMQTETNQNLRQEIIKLFGILGALDPYKQKMHMLGTLEAKISVNFLKEDSFRNAKNNEENNARKMGSNEKLQKILSKLNPNDDDYYPITAVMALLKVLKYISLKKKKIIFFFSLFSDPTLGHHYPSVIHSLVTILQSIGVKSVQFLPHILQAFTKEIELCEKDFRNMMFQYLCKLVNAVKQHVREFLSEFLHFVRTYWDEPYYFHLIGLIEEISSAVGEEFFFYSRELIPKILFAL